MIYNKLYANSMSFLVQFVNRLIAHLTQCKCYIFSCPNSQVTLTTKALGNSLSKMSSQVWLYHVLSVRCGEVPSAICTTQYFSSSFCLNLGRQLDGAGWRRISMFKSDLWCEDIRFQPFTINIKQFYNAFFEAFLKLF